ncbi:MAG: hypothetical protein ACHQNT_06100 [Bacteroidia bacterium]
MKALKIFIPVLSLFVISCENFTWFQSEDTIKKQLTGTWEREFLADTSSYEFWTLDNDEVKILRYDIASYPGSICITLPYPKPCGCVDDGAPDLNLYDNNDTMLLDNGKYIVDAKMDKAFLKTSELKGLDQNNYNHKWTIVEIEDNILYIAADDAEAAGNVQREFVKQK